MLNCLSDPGFGGGATGGASLGDGGGSAPANQTTVGCSLSCPIRFGSFQCSVDSLCPKGSGSNWNKCLEPDVAAKQLDLCRDEVAPG